jgi:hypothetical protein
MKVHYVDVTVGSIVMAQTPPHGAHDYEAWLVFDWNELSTFVLNSHGAVEGTWIDIDDTIIKAGENSP